MRLRYVVIAAGLALSAQSGTANAAYLFTFSQTSTGVVETGFGSLNIGNLYQYASGEQENAFVSPSDPGAGVGANAAQDVYAATFDSSQAFGTGPGGGADTGTGPLVAFEGGYDGIVAVPTGYVSGQLAPSSAFFSGQTFASLGLTPGTYVYNYGIAPEIDFISRAAVAEGYLDTITVQVGTVPLPASAPLFGAALAVLGVAGVGLKRRKVSAVF